MNTFYIVAFIILIIVAFCTGLIVGFEFCGSDPNPLNFNPLSSDEIFTLNLLDENRKLKKQIETLTSKGHSYPRDLEGNIIYESEE